MNKISRTLIILTVFVILCPAMGQADIIYITNDDKLFGTVQSQGFTIQTDYGKVDIKREFLKSITFNDGPIRSWTAETTNNDSFSGNLLNQHIRFLQEDGTQKIFGKNQIKRIMRENGDPSYPVMTTIFTMKNMDRFSGRLLDSELQIQTHYITKSIHTSEINRVEFSGSGRADIKILLENGDLITGTLKTDQFRMAPDAVDELSVTKSRLQSIQFNAPKLVLREFSSPGGSGDDSDGDGIPDFADICMNTPRGVAVGQDGCSRKSSLAMHVNGTQIRQAALDSGRKTDSRSENETILFDFDRFDLKPDYYSSLDSVALLLIQNPTVKVEIQGHTDNIGTAQYNQRLSENRARAVENYFIHKGVEKERLFPVGFGFTKSQASNENETGRALNRRVEIALQN